MKKMLNVILMVLVLAVVVFTSACGGNSSKGIKSKKIDTYLTNVNKDAEKFTADFDLKQYLIDYGAESFERYELYRSDGLYNLVVMVKFKNGITMEFNFYPDEDDMHGYGHLNAVDIYASSKDYVFDNGGGICSTWMREFGGDASQMLPPDTDFANLNSRYYMIIPADVFYMENYAGRNCTLYMRDYFDVGFKTSIVPYLELENVSFREDPFKDSQVIGGTSDNG